MATENVWVRGYRIAAREWSPLRVAVIMAVMGALFYCAHQTFLGTDFRFKLFIIAFAGPFVTQLVYRVIPKPLPPKSSTVK